MKLLDATGERDARWGRLRETALCTSNRQLFAQYLKVAQMPGLMRNAAHPAGDPGIKVYFGGRSSPLSQPITSSALRGSSRSHCSHRSERSPLSPADNARCISEPHCGHLMALGLCSMVEIF